MFMWLQVIFRCDVYYDIACLREWSPFSSLAPHINNSFLESYNISDSHDSYPIKNLYFTRSSLLNFVQGSREATFPTRDFYAGFNNIFDGDDSFLLSRQGDIDINIFNAFDFLELVNDTFFIKNQLAALYPRFITKNNIIYLNVL